MYEKQLEFPFMRRKSDYEIIIKYKGFTYRGYKRLHLKETSGLWNISYVHTLTGPNEEEVSYIKKDGQDGYESAKDFQEYVDMILEVAAPI